jgi:integrase
MALTTTAIRNAKPRAAQYKIGDSGGLFLLVTPSGGKWWRFKYRHGGKEKLLSLGTFPDTSLANARERRDAARRLVAAGQDPSAQRKAEKKKAQTKEQDSFEAVAREWYAKQANIWVAHHASDVLRRLETNLFPSLGATPIAEITAPMLLSTIRKIESRGAYDLAHRVLQVASQVFRYGVASGYCERDPAPDLRGALTPHKSKYQAAVRPEGVPALLRAVADYDQIGDRQTMLALQLLALTFVRTGELIGAEWAEFALDGTAPMWIVPAARMKMRTEHVVPLSRQAVAILRELRTIAGTSRYVLPGRNPDKPISNNTMLFALYRLGYKRRMTGHGFRAIASTLLNESGFRPDVIERQLAHCERNDVRGAYNRAEYLPERGTMMQKYADMLDSLVQGAQVIPLQRRV